MIEPVLAHPSDWLIQLVYLAPLAVLVVLLVAGRIRERRRRRSDSEGRH